MGCCSKVIEQSGHDVQSRCTLARPARRDGMRAWGWGSGGFGGAASWPIFWTPSDSRLDIHA